MDIQQPQNFRNQGSGNIGGSVTGLAQTRFFQDLYRAVKTPNFAVTKTVLQDIDPDPGAKVVVTWPTVLHNYLNCFNATNNACQPAVPGVYRIYASVTWNWPNNRPSGGSKFHLLICTPTGVVRASAVHEAEGETTEQALDRTLTVSCLDYLDGVGENAYRTIQVVNNANTKATIYGTDTALNFPRFEAHKITY